MKVGLKAANVFVIVLCLVFLCEFFFEVLSQELDHSSSAGSFIFGLWSFRVAAVFSAFEGLLTLSVVYIENRRRDQAGEASFVRVRKLSLQYEEIDNLKAANAPLTYFVLCILVCLMGLTSIFIYAVYS